MSNPNGLPSQKLCQYLDQARTLNGIEYLHIKFTAEIQRRLNLASTSFGRLSKRVFTNRDISTRT